MAQINQLSRIANIDSDMPVKNYGVSDIAYGRAVILDTTNTGGAGSPRGVTLPASSANPYGFALTTLAAGKMGTVQVSGLAIGIASGTIHVGDWLMVDSAGAVLAQTAALNAVGQAESEALTTEYVAVRISKAKNA